MLRMRFGRPFHRMQCREDNISLLFLLVLLLSYSCASKMDGLRRQSLETAYIEGKYEAIFRAVRTVFQNDAFVIEQSN